MPFNRAHTSARARQVRPPLIESSLIHIRLYSLTDTRQLNPPVVCVDLFFIKIFTVFAEKLTKMLKNLLSHNGDERGENSHIYPSYPDPYQKSMGSNSGRVPSPIQV